MGVAEVPDSSGGVVDVVQHLDDLVERARAGERDARERLVAAIQDRIYGLALRMLGVPAEAEDATQEILIKVVTRLGSFRGDSRFTTWVYAVAANHLRSVKASAWERRRLSFDRLSEQLGATLPAAAMPAVDDQVLMREVRLLCLHGLLMCLDRDARLSYVLGEALELSGTEGARVLGIQPAAFRKRLSRARAQLQAFLAEHCGLVRSTNRCHCELWRESIMAVGAIAPDQPLLATHPADGIGEDQLAARLSGLNELMRIRALFQTLPKYRTPSHLLDELSTMLDGPLNPSGW